MLLVGRDGDRLALDIAGYEFPRITTGDEDSNWLRIQIEVSTSRGSWGATDPMLLTDEVALLAQWLDSIANGDDVGRELDFTEPNLSFELVRQDLEVYPLRRAGSAGTDAS